MRKEGGILRLRIDDRSTPELTPVFLDDIFETLHWLGIDWDEGPRTPQEHRENIRNTCSRTMLTSVSTPSANR